MSKLVAIIVFEEVNLFTLSSLQEVFSLANLLSKDGDKYRIQTCSLEGGSIRTREGLALVTGRISDLLEQDIDTLVVAGGWGYEVARRNNELIAAVKKGAAKARRIAMLGGGVFVGAETGLLDRLRVSVHPSVVDKFRARYPNIDPDSTSIYMRTGKTWTSPGMATTVDLALALVEEDLGYQPTIEIARYLVVYMRRHEAQSQVSLMMDFQGRSSRFFKLNQWIADNLNEELSVEQLADTAGMSRRTFSRLYSKEMGASPAKVVASLRIEAALTALSDSTDNMANIAYRCGFGNEDRMRRAFLLKFGRPPSSFRKK